MACKVWLAATLLAGLGVAGASDLALEAGEPAAVYVRSYDGAFVAAAVRKPPGNGRFPAILFIHGGVGGRSVERMKEFTRGRVPEHFFKLGYAVMSTDYRRFHFGEDEIQDVLAAYRQLESYPFVDKSRLAVIGGSHGGYLAKMLATRASPAAVVSFAGLSDIEGMFYDVAQELRISIESWQDWREQLLAGREARTSQAQNRPAAPAPSPETARRFAGNITPRPGSASYEVALDLAWRFGDRRELYRAISPKDNAHKISSPLLYLVGGEDKLRFAGEALIDALRERGVKAEYSEHEGMGHGFYWGNREGDPPRQFYDALKVTTAFVERHSNGAGR